MFFSDLPCWGAAVLLPRDSTKQPREVSGAAFRVQDLRFGGRPPMVRVGFRHTRCQRKGGQGPGKGLGAAALGSGNGGILFWERAAEPVPKGKGPAEG